MTYLIDHITQLITALGVLVTAVSVTLRAYWHNQERNGDGPLLSADPPKPKPKKNAKPVKKTPHPRDGSK